MELRYWATFLASTLALASAIPASLVDEIKASEMRETNKVKRAHPPLPSSVNIEEGSPRDDLFFNNNNPSAIKRGVNLKTSQSSSEDRQSPSISDWQSDNDRQSIYQENPASLAEIQSTLYNNGDNPFDDKTVAEYEKGFRYGTNKEKLDEALENAVLKSELYGDQAAVNQYRYYGNEDRRRRRRRDAHRFRLTSTAANRMKRETDFTPEEILTILTLYENERKNNRPSESFPWNFESPSAADFLNQQQPDRNVENDDDDQNWLDAPVYNPHANNRLGPSYNIYEPDKRGRWGGLSTSSDRKKRFMVAKKRNDPTRELRYLNGPNKNDFYTLSQLLSNQRAEPNLPLYHRLVL